MHMEIDRSLKFMQLYQVVPFKGSPMYRVRAEGSSEDKLMAYALRISIASETRSQISGGCRFELQS